MRKYKVLKSILGTILILGTLVMIFMWEFYGREKLLYTELLSFNNDIMKGHVIAEEDIKTIKVEKNRVIDNAIDYINKDYVIGKRAKQFIPRNSQIHPYYFEMISLSKDQFIFELPDDWIVTYPGSLRSGDTIFIYEINKDLTINELSTNYPNKGEFLTKLTVAYIKDAANNEVLDNSIEDRFTVSATIDRIEVIIDKEQLALLKNSIYKDNRFIIVYGEEQ